jgi:hypothetical protein
MPCSTNARARGEVGIVVLGVAAALGGGILHEQRDSVGFMTAGVLAFEARLRPVEAGGAAIMHKRFDEPLLSFLGSRWGFLES